MIRSAHSFWCVLFFPLTVALLLSIQAHGQALSVAVAPSAVTRSPNDETIRQKLDFARGLYEAGAFALADKVYRRVLTLAPDNKTALLGRKLVELARQPSWAQDNPSLSSETESIEAMARAAVVATESRMASTILPEVSFERTPIAEATEFLQHEIARLDKDSGVELPGLRISLQRPSPPPNDANAVPIVGLPPSVPSPSIQPDILARTIISLKLLDVSLLEAVKATAAQAGMRVKVGADQIWITQSSESTGGFITAEYHLQPGQYGFAKTESSSTSPTNDVIGRSVMTVVRQDAKSFLEANGVRFPPGASATYLPTTHKLVVRDTEDNLNLVRCLVDAASSPTLAPAHR